MERKEGPVAEQTPGTAGWMRRVQSWGERNASVQRLRAFYDRHSAVAPFVFFFGGVLWDALTLRRIDAWFDNLFLLAYLVVLGGLIVLAALVEHECIHRSWCLKYRDWYPPAIQFVLGALLSAYVVFYFQSASLTETSIFFGLLVVLLVINEFIHQRLFNLYLLFALYFFACFSFFIFFIPVVVKTMSYATFVAGGVLSLGVVGMMLVYLRRRAVFASGRQLFGAVGIVVALFSMLNLFYLQNWMPPVPLALRFGGVFHHASRHNGVYELRYEQPEWYQFWVDSDERFHYAPGDTVFCFAAVFAPTQLEKQIYHVWSYYEDEQRAWVTTDRMAYDVIGGRYGGYRGYTFKQNVRPGTWRVDVQTDEGFALGRIRFVVEPVEEPITDLKSRIYR